MIGAHKIRETPSARTVVGAAALGAAFAWLVASAAVTESVRWPVLVVLPLTLLFGLLVGVVTRGVAGIPDRGWRGIAGRAAVAVALGVVVGELAALVVFSRSVDNRLDQRALRDADATPAVAQAAASLQQSRDARAALDAGVERARERQDAALVVARCEYHPTPACPQTRITGIPGAGPETRTADDLLADAQRQLDDALADRDRRAPGLDAAIVSEQQNLSAARAREVGDARRGLGARWSAMNDLTLADVGALTLRLAIIASCALLYLLPLLLALWRRHTLDHHRASASAERERAELDADTAIAVKQAEVRREAEILWAEHRLAQARLAVEAQLEIDREQQRRRVQDALGEAVRASSEREFEPGAQDMYLPIAAEAEAAALAAVRRIGLRHRALHIAPTLPALCPHFARTFHWQAIRR
ncbi:putative integral membrane protein [Mycobacterium bohemicum DSM 44277]|uniref:Putative integral membrane protein n=1 Tax=Mycobacterium bohemicum DSM 44277 TaxID=1236609 RepID=A0A0U0W582_MYCBE|nr:putative integral membrane protein [Mycobacterium bohemicum DSM 44277]